MNHQSEHLSSAQVEEYWSKASGAGPETEEWVEKHLADCPSCRSRVLEFQRTQFGLLADPKVNTVPTSDCPSEDDLRHLAAGICSESTAQKLTAHASACTHCGPLLREYTEDFSGNFTPEEQTILDGLSSASREWQRQKAREMLQQDRPAETEKSDALPRVADSTPDAGSPTPPAKESLEKARRLTLPWKWIMVPAAAAVAFIAVGLWYLQRDTPEKVAKLEAQGYAQQRTLEMRVPYAAHADFNERRSGKPESPLNLPASMNEAIVKISEHLKKEPDNPLWLLLSARFDLLDWNPESAFKTLDQISDPQITGSPEYLMTRSLALYERAEISKQHQDYAQAVDLLSQALQKSPQDPLLLFNRAVACEKILAYECATADWNHFLQVEKDPQWRSEGQQRLDKLKEKKTPAH